MDPLTQKIEEQIKTLPSVTQRALHDFDWKTQILSIGKTYDLNLDQLDTLEQETTLVLVGLIPASSYVSELKKRLEISTTAASQIVEEANNKIFIPLRDVVLQYAEEDRDQHETLRDAGIHIGEEDTSTEQQETQKSTPNKISLSVDTTKEANPAEDLPPMPVKNSIEQKLSGSHTTQNIVSNHSSDTKELPPMPVKQSNTSHDPYREPLA